VEAVKRHVTLIGFMGAGKSTIGPRVARQLGRPFVDTDAAIAAEHGSIPNIFAELGEPQFRVLEYAAIERALQAAPSVIALGGGALTKPAARELVAQHSVRVYLRAAAHTLFKRVRRGGGRPVLGTVPSLERIEALLDARAAHYEEAEIVVLVDGRRPGEIAREIVSRLDG
jgi:shikimate kinase